MISPCSYKRTLSPRPCQTVSKSYHLSIILWLSIISSHSSAILRLNPMVQLSWTTSSTRRMIYTSWRALSADVFTHSSRDSMITSTRATAVPYSHKVKLLIYFSSMTQTPFHIRDQVRNAKFLSLYHWLKWLGNHPRQSYFIAKKKTLQIYPINPSEPLYRQTKSTASS